MRFKSNVPKDLIDSQSHFLDRYGHRTIKEERLDRISGLRNGLKIFGAIIGVAIFLAVIYLLAHK